jgi:hypothetical protein
MLRNVNRPCANSPCEAHPVESELRTVLLLDAVSGTMYYQALTSHRPKKVMHIQESAWVGWLSVSLHYGVLVIFALLHFAGWPPSKL